MSTSSTTVGTWYENDDSRFPGPYVGSVVWREGRRVVITRVEPVGQHRFAGGRDSEYSHYDGYNCEGRPVTAADVLKDAQREACPWPRIRRTAEETGFDVDEQGLGTFVGRVTVSVLVEVKGLGTNEWGYTREFGDTVWFDLPGFGSLDAAREAVAKLDGATLPWRATGKFKWLKELKHVRVTHGYAYCYCSNDEHPFYREFLSGPPL